MRRTTVLIAATAVVVTSALGAVENLGDAASTARTAVRTAAGTASGTAASTHLAGGPTTPVTNRTSNNPWD